LKKWYYNSWLLAAMYVVGGIGSLFLIGLPILITAIVFTALKTGFEKKVTSEDLKIYQDYIEKNKTLAELDNKITDKAQMISADAELLNSLEEKIKMLQEQLDLVEEKKEEIINLQNGKAGSVYVISNLGSFGDSVYKVGMTRRLDPFDRIKELGSASVPFQFDVHSMIFSDDAVNLESKMHEILDEKRVNKVNKRKEFFYSSIDELENIVTQIDPAAEFNRTLLAEEYRQTQSMAYIN
jgi:hypothetical protein